MKSAIWFWPAAPATSETTAAHVEQRVIPERAALRRPALTAVQWVGILAFGQSVIFLVVWLFVCASAGAAPALTDWANPPIKLSTYEPQQGRDPLRAAGSATQALGGEPLVEARVEALRLQGIVYDATRPSAMVNNEILYVGRATRLATSDGTVEVTAVAITRDRVTVEIGGKQIELQMPAPNP